MKTTQQVIEELSNNIEPQLKKIHQEKNIPFPASTYRLLIYKHERQLHLWAKENSQWHLLKEYPLTAFSGVLGPKLQEGDLQIPEGIYQQDYLNPNSKFTLSVKINYPNEFDLKQAALDGRTHLGDDIFIHGKDQSEGCIAIGDDAIEEIFYLAAIKGFEKIIISPYHHLNSVPKEMILDNIHWYAALVTRILYEIYIMENNNKNEA